MSNKAIRLADVAKAAGVSQGTASNVFSRPQIVREEVRERVRAVAKEMGYNGPDPRGRMLRAGKVNAIGVVTSEPLSYFFNDPYARVLMEGITEACDAGGAGISLVSSQNREELAWNINSALVDGFVLFCLEGDSRLIELTRERTLPFVALALGFEDQSIPAIGVDNIAGARMMARHVAELGHRRVAILSLPFADDRFGPASMDDVHAAIYATSSDRIAGYFEGLAEFGIDTAKVPVFETQNDGQTTRAGLEYLFSQAEPPTAILAMSDRIALDALDWLRQRGIKVPLDVSVAGFDGVPEAALSSPPLTTVAQPIAEIGRRAVKAILDGASPGYREMLDLELVVRGSTATPKN
ncbi:transcriptional regulator, LacI family [Mesorhizobium albiziae]|uniref:Transcriptional regulator, LacI family n=1 Tax=Neomesorhizobium albiziae TaxID=335020 RepID=A0A1I4CM24_9HYPH|nr:LacI family transcriptional regulator [Mesorhizobium albiziae]SFK81001.1 transcriptional regulator, LacI family [Mesorhizobium albiziae]